MVLRHKKEARIEKRRRVYTARQHGICTVYFKQASIQIFQRCVQNLNLPEVRHPDQDFIGSGAQGRMHSGVS